MSESSSNDQGRTVPITHLSSGSMRGCGCGESFLSSPPQAFINAWGRCENWLWGHKSRRAVPAIPQTTATLGTAGPEPHLVEVWGASPEFESMGELSPLLVCHVVVQKGERYFSLWLAPYHLPQMRELTLSLTSCSTQETVPKPLPQRYSRDTRWSEVRVTHLISMSRGEMSPLPIWHVVAWLKERCHPHYLPPHQHFRQAEDHKSERDVHTHQQLQHLGE